MPIDVIGLEDQAEDALKAIERQNPILFYGPTGNGKTILAWKVAKTIAKELDVPVIYLQLYPELTKNNLIGGETIKNGSIVIEEQAILKFGAKGKGAIFIVDECTHTIEPVLLAFNSLIEEPFQTVVGSEIYTLDEKTRFIFCGNYPDHIGNIHLPTSFQNRLYVIKVELPSKEDLVKIGRTIEASVPLELLEFVANIIIQTHEPAFPISGRNMVMAISSIPSIYNHSKPKHGKLPKDIKDCCMKFKIDEECLKRTLLSTMMGNLVMHTNGPEKIAALLW